jgi:hypothetical protein
MKPDLIHPVQRRRSRRGEEQDQEQPGQYFDPRQRDGEKINQVVWNDPVVANVLCELSRLINFQRASKDKDAPRITRRAMFKVFRRWGSISSSG